MEQTRAGRGRRQREAFVYLVLGFGNLASWWMRQSCIGWRITECHREATYTSDSSGPGRSVMRQDSRESVPPVLHNRTVGPLATRGLLWENSLIYSPDGRGSRVPPPQVSSTDKRWKHTVVVIRFFVSKEKRTLRYFIADQHVSRIIHFHHPQLPLLHAVKGQIFYRVYSLYVPHYAATNHRQIYRWRYHSVV